MTESVTEQDVASPDRGSQLSDKELNFRRLEAMRDSEREARLKAEWDANALKNELEQLKQMLAPKEKDPLDDVDEYVDATVLKAKLAHERATFERRAEEIAKRTYASQKEADEKKNFDKRLRQDYRDFDSVMTEKNLIALDAVDPYFLKTVTRLPDEYEKRALTYEKLKHSWRRSQKYLNHRSKRK